MTCGIYSIKHVATGKTYVGQSIDIEQRFLGHKRGSSGKIADAIEEFGWKSFEKAILETCSPYQLNELEKKWVLAMNSMYPSGFNVYPPGTAAPFRKDVPARETMIRIKENQYQAKARQSRLAKGDKFIGVWFTPTNVAKLEKYRREGQTLVDIVNKAIEAF
jgi:group I intron endonuclease